MADTENVYVKKIKAEDKEKIVENSVQSLSARPTSNATEMKKRFVAPIIDVAADGNYGACLAKEVDRVADEADNAISVNAQEIATLDADLEAHKSLTNTAISVLLAKNVEIEQKINDNANDISMTNDALSTHTIHANTTFGTDITAEMSQTDFKITLRLKNANGEYIGNGVVIDLPLEELVVSGELDEDANEIVLTLKSGQEIRIKVGELVRGLVTTASKGQPYGVASLDADGKVPAKQLPEDAFVKAVIPSEKNVFYFPALSKNADNTVTFWSIKGTPEPSGEKVVIRSKQGRAQMQDPVEPMDIANRRFVEETVANAGNGGGGEKLYKHKLRFVAAAVWHDGYEATFDIDFVCSIPDSFSMENIFDKIVQMNAQCELYRFRGSVSYQMHFPQDYHGAWATRDDFFVVDAMVPYSEDDFMSAMVFIKTLNEPEDTCWVIVDIISDEVEKL